MNSKIYYVNTSITRDCEKNTQSTNNNYRNKRLSNPNISFDHRNITQIENQKFQKNENSDSVNYFFRRDENQSSIISENSSNYQYSKNEQKIQFTKLKKTANISKNDLPDKKTISSVKKSESVFSNQQLKDSKDIKHPINYGYYESKYSKKKSNNAENMQENNDLKISKIKNINKIKTHNNSIINSQFYGKTISDLNYYRFPSVSNNDSIENHKDYNLISKKSPQLIPKKFIEKKKASNSYVSSDFVFFSPIKQGFENSSFNWESSDFFTENNQSFSIISKKKSENKSDNKIMTINKKKLSFQAKENDNNINKNLFNINDDIRGIKIVEINKITPKEINSNNSKNKTRCQNFNLELKNFEANSQIISPFSENNRNKSQTISSYGENNRNKSHNISNKRLNSDNFNNKIIIFTKSTKIVTPNNNTINNEKKTEEIKNKKINTYTKYKKFIDNDEILSYETITEPNSESILSEKERKKINDFKSDKKKTTARQIFSEKDRIKSNKVVSSKENDRVKNKLKMEDNITLKKNKSSKINPFDFNKKNKIKNKITTNKKKEDKKLSSTNILNVTNITSNMINTKTNNVTNISKNTTATKKYPSDTELKNNHTFYAQSSVENKNQFSRLTISNSKTTAKKNLTNNSKRSPTNFAKFESFPSNLNQKEDEWDQIQYLGMRKSTYDPGKRANKKHGNDPQSINAKFSSTNYIKAVEAMSIPGKNECGFKKTNQDTYLIERNINGILNFNIFGVLDGHGSDGHFASQFVSRYIIYRIKNHPKIKLLDEPNEIYHRLKENGYKIIANIFIDADCQIQKEKFDFHKSGTTCVIVIQLEEHLICANAGDSRAILVFDENYDDNLANSQVYCLSYDCKPDLPIEKKRIYEKGGTVEKALDENDVETGPYRVWAKDEDYPGLAMSRSIGDIEAKKYGVIPNPQIVEYTLSYYSKYMIICSDGVWEFIDNKEAMQIGNKYFLRNDPNGLCQELIHQSVDCWLNDDIVIDDITVVTVFF